MCFFLPFSSLLTWLEEHREPEIDGLEGGVIVFIHQQEILRLQVPVHDPQRMAGLHNPNNYPDELCRLALTEMPPLDDPVEELPAGAQLHHDVHVQRVLVGALDSDDVLVAGEVVHDLDLPPHVLHVLLRYQLPLADGLAGVVVPRGDLSAQVRGAELPLPQLPPQDVQVPDVGRLVAEHVVGARVEAPPHDDGGGGGLTLLIGWLLGGVVGDGAALGLVEVLR
ncbi:hypothetical protein MUK42_07025 [Musa troglodytarum]|uniref:Uncharacterized protein n=1 Tax=Musa troglodytarum TaxID=320322 RepID=A0A9E7JXW8_9LILI|nr:hypothetical protein MUK42_07025 [Musa troglodytarum]